MKPDFSKGLIPAIIIDSTTKEVLMLAYMNEVSYQKTLETNETWFYSRSRDQLWHKGATSGHTQQVVSIRLDCDQDTLLIEVVAQGPACHTGATSCFFNEVKSPTVDYHANILEQVVAEIRDREQTPIAGSYTNYLLDKGIDKIGKKVVEEAGEVVIAAKNDDAQELIGEVSDLLYHSLVLLHQQGVNFNDVKKELTRRFGKKANSKGDRPEIEEW
ncbi:bifunctional phosphoribosyl-AMP cyclohydrolase/phosphoribosyl-ATP diphosphatase HisIE [Amphibacillus sediminis]|uniref:bifunctional phosphoribosyl-AMP cyclohydrolase/phosphoribosyl-ATP diphosphatase HisIE n=1 Tax=Amphibacillus sediminis TaxID=360185 RepID=UPI000833FE2A|nr:bifunctional phosphoribosyl-AMP cyclohydrolase/phosphoribosyl-ATP diphosphatase HisIE [Amphibacillus sediminis]